MLENLVAGEIVFVYISRPFICPILEVLHLTNLYLSFSRRSLFPASKL